MNWYLKVLKQYADFSGRARRKEYWMFILFHIIFLIAAMVIDMLVGTTFGVLSYGLVYVLYSLALLVPSLAVIVRRLHDTNRSGAWIFIGLIPLIGGIWLLVLMCLEGTQGENKYGQDPKKENSFSTEALDGNMGN